MAKSFFEDIELYITEELMKAHSSVIVAVAWFTNKRLLSILEFKQKNGVKIEIIINDDKTNHDSLDFTKFKELGGEVLFTKSNKSLMHCKFCIIDDAVLITGSYNWTTKAEESNKEQITISSGDSDEISKFKKEFYDIKNKEKNIEDKKIEQIKKNMVYISTPYSFAEIGANLSIFPQRIMWRISEHLQDYVHNYYEAQEKGTSDKNQVLWSSESDIPSITIDFMSLNISASHYVQFEKVIDTLRNIAIDVPTYENGLVIKSHPVFSNVEIPVANVKKSSGENYPNARRVGVIKFYFNKETIHKVFDMRKGYIKHLANIVDVCSKKNTPRIYLLLKRMQSPLGKVIQYNDLKKFVGAEASYPKWARFSQKVLDVAKKELDDLAKRGETDITFDYEPVYRNLSRKRGNPECVRFVIKVVK